MILFLPELKPKQLDIERIYDPKNPDSIMYSNIFAKCSELNMTEYKERRFFKFVNWLAENNYCNVIRCFATWTDDWDVYYNKTKNIGKVNAPHPLDWKTLQFDVETIDPLYEETLLNRLEFVADTGITPEIIFKYQPHGWGAHWQNPQNSSGFRGSQFYWDRDYGLWQWEEYAEAEPEAIPEYRDGKITRETALKWIRQYKANKEYDLWFIPYMIQKIKDRIGNRFIIGQNEVIAGFGFHQQMKNLVYKPQGLTKRRLITSLPFDFALAGKAKGYTLDIHGIRTVAQYEKVKAELAKAGITEQIRVNSDGYGPYWYQTPDESDKFAEKQYRQLVTRVFKNGDHFQGNGWFYGKRKCRFIRLERQLEVPNKILKHRHKAIILK